MAYTKRGPFINASPTGPWVDADFFNTLEDTLVAASGNGYVAPAATGNPATDTANILAAISTAQANFWDLYLPAGKYQLTSPITWNANKGSLRGNGDVILDWYTVGRSATPFTGAALTITGNANGASPSGNPLNHVATKYVVEHLKLNGPDIDAGTIDGILFDDPGIGIDFVTVRHLQIYGMRDGITYGANTWSQSVERCTIAVSHRYGINLTCGANAGEATTLTNTTIFNCHNASNTAAAIYAPATSNVEFRMLGGSLDYNDIEGAIYGGSLSFHAVHIEDNRTGAMFFYTQSQSIINVSFRDCAWDSSATAVRPYIHQILAGSGPKITITFDGDKGGLYPNTNSTWLMDTQNTGVTGAASSVQGWHVDTGSTMLGQFYNLLSNGDFGASSSFVASPGVAGWAIPGTGTWTIGAGGNPGAALKLVASTSTTANTVQRIPIPANRQPIRVTAKMMVTALTSGNIQTAVQFYAADGTTAVGGAFRIGSPLSTVDSTNWTYVSQRYIPPQGAAYLSVQLGSGSFVGTGLWDEVEAVPV